MTSLKVYVVTYGAYHDDNEVVGVYVTKEEAEKALNDKYGQSDWEYGTIEEFYISV